MPPIITPEARAKGQKVRAENVVNCLDGHLSALRRKFAAGQFIRTTEAAEAMEVWTSHAAMILMKFCQMVLMEQSILQEPGMASIHGWKLLPWNECSSIVTDFQSDLRRGFLAVFQDERQDLLQEQRTVRTKPGKKPKKVKKSHKIVQYRLTVSLNGSTDDFIIRSQKGLQTAMMACGLAGAEVQVQEEDYHWEDEPQYCFGLLRQFLYHPKPAPEPCQARPGSPEKVALMRKRYLGGHAIFHDQDLVLEGVEPC